MKKYYPYLIGVNVIWAVSALVYDIPAISHIPFYFWPFIVICPVFPALLALTWWQIFRNNKPNDYLLAFATLPSAIYLLGALIFYPTLMVINGFNWLDFGQIFWAAVYGLQGFYLMRKYTLKKSPVILVTTFLLISFFIQYLTKTYGYLDFSSINSQLLLALYFVLSAISLIFAIGYTRKQYS